MYILLLGENVNRPALIERLGRTRKGSRHEFGLYQCPLCSKKFEARISDVANDHTISCGCRKKKNFVAHLERRVLGKVTSQALARLWGDRCRGESKAYIMKKYGIRPSEYPTALRLAETHRSAVASSMQALDSKPIAKPCEGIYTASPAAQKQSLADAPPQTIINMEAGGLIKYNPELEKKPVPYEQTELGYAALGNYWQEYKQEPPEGFDLQAWAQLKRMN
jgi:hypothetical protein